MNARGHMRTFPRRVRLEMGLLTVLAVASVATAAPIVDGLFDPAEGYSQGWYVDFAVERSDTIVTGGQLWVHEDTGTGDVTVLFTQPLTLVDNTYGDNAVGWGKSVAPSGKNHNFKDLIGSDKARFVFTDGAGRTVLDVTADYMSASSDPSGYGSLGVTGRDGAVDFGDASDVLAVATSLDYNFNSLGHVLTADSPATDADYTPNPTYAGWVFEVTYEMRVAGAPFGEAGFGGVDIPIVHDSPNKIGRNKVYPEPGPPVPEPATLGLLAIGGLAVLRRRRK